MFTAKETLVLITIVVIALVLGLGISYGVSTVNVDIFNQKYGTSYTTFQWMFAQNTIVDYVENGKIQTIKLKQESPFGL